MWVERKRVEGLRRRSYTGGQESGNLQEMVITFQEYGFLASNIAMRRWFRRETTCLVRVVRFKLSHKAVLDSSLTLETRSWHILNVFSWKIGGEMFAEKRKFK